MCGVWQLDHIAGAGVCLRGISVNPKTKPASRKVLACAFVGSVLFTDAIGLSQLSCAVRYGEYCLVQYAICLVLVLLSCYHQVRVYGLGSSFWGLGSCI